MKTLKAKDADWRFLMDAKISLGLKSVSDVLTLVLDGKIRRKKK